MSLPGNTILPSDLSPWPVCLISEQPTCCMGTPLICGIAEILHSEVQSAKFPLPSSEIPVSAPFPFLPTSLLSSHSQTAISDCGYVAMPQAGMLCRTRLASFPVTLQPESASPAVLMGIFIWALLLAGFLDLVLANGMGMLWGTYCTNGSFYLCCTSAIRDECTGNSHQQVASFFIP